MQKTFARGEPDPSDEAEGSDGPKLLTVLGPGLITGASDDDPSGIATYSQAGAQFGYNTGWTLLVSWPLMCAIQEISARIGRVTGKGIAANVQQRYPNSVVGVIVMLLLAANTINIGADLGAMAAALQLVIGGPELLYVGAFALVCVGLETFVRYDRYARVLKWLTLALFAYVGVAFVVQIPWGTVALRMVAPQIDWTPAYITTVVAILGTTISPYLFFWQANEEVEKVREADGAEPLERAPHQAKAEFKRIRLDTYIGMGLSNLVALFIILTTAATLHAHGVTDIQTSSQAAEALRPVAGPAVFVIFALGIIGTGLLAVPVLAGSAAYAVGESFGWRVGLTRTLRRAKGFYGVIAAATIVGAFLNFTSIDPIRALFWSAVINGLVAVPVMVIMMLLGGREDVMGRFTLPTPLRVVGWTATAVMAAAAVAMFATWDKGG